MRIDITDGRAGTLYFLYVFGRWKLIEAWSSTERLTSALSSLYFIALFLIVSTARLPFRSHEAPLLTWSSTSVQGGSYNEFGVNSLAAPITEP